MAYKDKEKARAAKNASYAKNKDKYLETERVRRLNETDEQRVARLEYHKKYYQENKESCNASVRNSTLKRKYGISQEDYAKMHLEQNGACSICKTKNFSTKRNKMLCVDHNHETGKARALLCDTCNLLIGFAYEDESILLDAIEYIRKHK